MSLQLRVEGEAPEQSYTTRVEEISSSRIALQRPSTGQELVHFSPGTAVTMELTRNYPPREGHYWSDTTVSGGTWHPVPLVYLDPPKTWYRMQVRKHFRVEAALAVQFRPAEGHGKVWRQGTTKDVSGGGCQVIASVPMDEEQPVELVIALPDHKFRAIGVVRRSHEVEEELNQWALGIEFTDISEDDRSAVIRFAFQRQIELRKKGMA